MRPVSTAFALLALAGAAAAQAPRVSADPDSARLVTSDVALFWEVYDRAAPDSLAALLERDYLQRGTAGLRDFVPGRILGAEQLAERILAERERYESRRAVSMAVLEAEPAIRAVFHELKRIYPDAVFPDVYFVVGRFNSGGTTSSNGLLIGAEMQRDASAFPRIVAHELIHFQQARSSGPVTLLGASIREGSADFIGELIAGSHINEAAHAYGLAHEAELWAEFSAAMNGLERSGWLYGGQPEGRPADLGYFFGYRIAQAYYERAADKAQAVRDILTTTDAPGFLRRSGYSPVPGLTPAPAREEDVASIDGIVAAFYDVISGPAGQPRQWARDSTLYAAGLLFTIVSRAEDAWRARRIDHAGFVRSTDAFMRGGFFEREIHRETQRFGPIAHVFSTYEWRRAGDGPVGGRGINSLQLFHDGRRWWILSAMWTDEDERNPIPAAYLPRR